MVIDKTALFVAKIMENMEARPVTERVEAMAQFHPGAQRLVNQARAQLLIKKVGL